MSRRTIEDLMKRIREELRAEGPDEAGYSDFMILQGMNSAIQDLAEVFPINDVEKITTEEEKKEYDLSDNIYKIDKVQYDGRKLEYMQTRDYVDYKVDEDPGPVNRWTLYGKKLILVGKVEDGKELSLWVSRSPKRLEGKGDVPEVPDYADEAIVAYAMSICCREGRSFDRADYYYTIYLNQKQEILRRTVPGQGQSDRKPRARDDYWPTFRPSRRIRTSDTNPGGR